MQDYNFEGNRPVLQDSLIETWSREAKQLCDKPGSLGSALHKMSQQVTTMLTLLELAEMTGEMPQDDVKSLLDSARELREYIMQLRAVNSTTML